MSHKAISESLNEFSHGDPTRFGTACKYVIAELKYSSLNESTVSHVKLPEQKAHGPIAIRQGICQIITVLDNLFIQHYTYGNHVQELKMELIFSLKMG